MSDNGDNPVLVPDPLGRRPPSRSTERRQVIVVPEPEGTVVGLSQMVSVQDVVAVLETLQARLTPSDGQNADVVVALLAASQALEQAKALVVDMAHRYPKSPRDTRA